MNNIKGSTVLVLLWGLMLPGILTTSAEAKKFQILHAFTGGSDGGKPYAELIMDKTGNLFGTANSGGDHLAGVVFKLTSDFRYSVLYSFMGGNLGDSPESALLLDKKQNLYGTTLGGGENGCCGTVFELDASGHEKILYAFGSGSDDDGGQPQAGVVADKAGNLYGTTPNGGEFFDGIAFKIAPDGTETILHAFTGGADGAWPYAPLVLDKAGNLYGTAIIGGTANSGTLFKIAPSGDLNVLSNFGGFIGDEPASGVLRDKPGNFYGTAIGGGQFGYGVVFKIGPDGKGVALYNFTGGSDGSKPSNPVVMDKKGNLYGTTTLGGDTGCNPPYGCGTVYKLAPDGTEAILHAFAGGPHDGALPYAGVILDTKSNLYGTTSAGGPDNAGVVFKIKN